MKLQVLIGWEATTPSSELGNDKPEESLGRGRRGLIHLDLCTSTTYRVQPWNVRVQLTITSYAMEEDLGTGSALRDSKMRKEQNHMEKKMKFF